MTASADGPEVLEPSALRFLDDLVGLGCTRDDGLNYASARGSIGVDDLRGMDVDSAVASGIRLSVDIEVETWHAELRGQPGGGFSIIDNGLAAEVFPQPELALVNRAVEDTDVQSLLRLCAEHPAAVVAEYELSPDAGYQWFRTHTSLMALLAAPTRLRAVDRLLAGPGLVLVSDLGDTIVQTSQLVISGRLTEPPVVQRMGKPRALSPLPGAHETQLTRALRRVAFEAAWAELATDVHWRHGDVPVARFEGARTVEVELDVDPTPDQHADTLALWSWATATEDIDRREAVQQAAALAIHHPSDLAGAARRGLPTARSIYNLARRGVVAEALAARRAARDAAATAARSAADAAGEAATKARDRMLVQVVGAVGVAAARATDVLSAGEARALLGVLGVVVVGLVVIALKVDLPAAQARLDSFAKDIDEYSEALDSESLDSIKRMESLAAARADLDRSRLSIVISAALILSGVLAVSFGVD